MDFVPFVFSMILLALALSNCAGQSVGQVSTQKVAPAASPLVSGTGSRSENGKRNSTAAPVPVLTESLPNANEAGVLASASVEAEQASFASPTRRRSRSGRARGKRKDPNLLSAEVATTSDASSEPGYKKDSPAARMIAAALRGNSKPKVAPSEADTSSKAGSESVGNTKSPGRRRLNTLDSIEYDSDASGDCADSEGSGVESVGEIVTGIKSYQPPRLPVDEDGNLKVMVSRVVSPSELYVHVVADEPVKHLNTVTDLLAEFNPDSSSEQFVPRICEPCCARFPKDSGWYRAVCEGLCVGGDGPKNVESIRVRYVDYGEVADLLPSEVRPLPKNLLHFPILAVRCSLAVLELSEDEEIYDPVGIALCFFSCSPFMPMPFDFFLLEPSFFVCPD